MNNSPSVAIALWVFVIQALIFTYVWWKGGSRIAAASPTEELLLLDDLDDGRRFLASFSLTLGVLGTVITAGLAFLFEGANPQLGAEIFLASGFGLLCAVILFCRSALSGTGRRKLLLAAFQEHKEYFSREESEKFALVAKQIVQALVEQTRPAQESVPIILEKIEASLAQVSVEIAKATELNKFVASSQVETAAQVLSAAKHSVATAQAAENILTKFSQVSADLYASSNSMSRVEDNLARFPQQFATAVRDSSELLGRSWGYQASQLVAQFSAASQHSIETFAATRDQEIERAITTALGLLEIDLRKISSTIAESEARMHTVTNTHLKDMAISVSSAKEILSTFNKATFDSASLLEGLKRSVLGASEVATQFSSLTKEIINAKTIMKHSIGEAVALAISKPIASLNLNILDVAIANEGFIKVATETSKLLNER